MSKSSLLTHQLYCPDCKGENSHSNVNKSNISNINVPDNVDSIPQIEDDIKNIQENRTPSIELVILDAWK